MKVAFSRKVNSVGSRPSIKRENIVSNNGALDLGTHRYLGDALPLRFPVEATPRTYYGFLVYEGGHR